MANSMDRRTFLKLAGGALALSSSAAWSASRGTFVNDVHSQLNPTWVKTITSVDSLPSLQKILNKAKGQKMSLSVCGGRHAGGGQQFGSDTVLIDTHHLNNVLSFDTESGLLEVQAGICWPELLNYLQTAEQNSLSAWGIAQKQTGADHLALGGTVSANAHGQGLRLKPFIQDVESFVLVDAQGEVHKCDRKENSELFRLVLGGYGLFGVIYSVTLQLVPRRKVERVVEMIGIDQLIPMVETCSAAGYPYGDYQVNINNTSDRFLKDGIFCSYRLADPQTPIIHNPKQLNTQDWFDFVYGAHVNKHDTFERYLHYYQSTSGIVNWSDVWQSGPYLANYHRIIDRRLHSPHKATEVLTEIYIPRQVLANFMDNVRTDFQKNNVNLIYSTVRFIERDDESFLPWAKESYACIIFNLHTVHTPEGIEHSANAFRRLIDLAITYGGSYYLTYHKYANRDQVLSCYPKFQEFLRLKQKYDPEERFQSNWYRHYKQLFL